jgi:hypothetical protein
MKSVRELHESKPGLSDRVVCCRNAEIRVIEICEDIDLDTSCCVVEFLDVVEDFEIVTAII